MTQTVQSKRIMSSWIKRCVISCFLVVPIILILYGFDSSISGVGNVDMKEQYINDHLIINEVVSNGLISVRISKDQNEYSPDWIEIYNPTERNINAGDYYLSDDANYLFKWRLPNENIYPGEYRIIYADGDRGLEQMIQYDMPEWYAPFAVSSDGETLFLSKGIESNLDEDDSATSSKIVDVVEVPRLGIDESFGRRVDSKDIWAVLAYPTPGASNAMGLNREIRTKKIEGEILFSLPTGFYEDAFDLHLSCSDPNSIILYTLDGSEPNESSSIYYKSIRVSSLMNLPNMYTTIPCNNDEVGFAIEYGINKVPKCTIVRARIYKDGYLSNKIYTAVYFIGQKYSLPVISLATAPNDLFSYEDGIYIGGQFYNTALSKGINNRWMGNWSMDRSIRGNVQMLDTEGNVVLDSDANVSLAGNASRTWPLQKSFHLELDNTIQSQDIWNDNPHLYATNSITLRGQSVADFEYGTAVLRDLLCNNLFADISGQDFYQFPVIAFIDGEYWGIYTIKEWKDENFFRGHFDTSNNLQVFQLKSNLYTDNIEWVMKIGNMDCENDLNSYFEEVMAKNFANEEDWYWLCSTMDINSFLSLCFIRIYCGNGNGLMNNNLIVWRDLGDSSVDNLKWHWLGFDYDYVMLDVEEDTLGNLLRLNNSDSNYIAANLLIKLWNECEEFRSLLKAYCEDILSNQLSHEELKKNIESFYNMLDGEMQLNIDRLEYRVNNYFKDIDDSLLDCIGYKEPVTYSDWIESINNLYDFIEGRSDRVSEMLLTN